MRFVDLFAGLGGFHVALSRLGHECVFASEIDEGLRELYRENFQLNPLGDIRGIDVGEIPAHEILCAGFPCQSFSKAGEQNGLNDPRGELFYQIMRIVEHHRPRFLFLENVPNIERHDQGRTWQRLITELVGHGYDISPKRLSPHRFGIPQIRERMFIVADAEGLGHFRWPEEQHEATSIRSILEDNPKDARPLPVQVSACIEMWQRFLNLFPENEQLPSFPIWGMEFGADYPFENEAPYAIGSEKLRQYRGANGVSLSDVPEDKLFASLPSYARTNEAIFPSWKRTFIRQNRELYERHRSWIDDWKAQLLDFAPSFQKFEWNAKGEVRDLSQLVLQVRASGLRAKRATTSPSLVAMTTTQVPIISWERRYMTPRECARLQSMEELTLPKVPTRAYKALGNAVNVRVVELVAQALLNNRTQRGIGA